MMARAAKRETEAVGWTEFSGEEGKGVGAGSKTVSPGPASVGRGGEVTWPKSENAGRGESQTHKIVLFSLFVCFFRKMLASESFQ